MRDDLLSHQINALFAGCETLEDLALRLSKSEGARIAAEVERDALKAQVEALKGVRDIQGQLIDARSAEVRDLEGRIARRDQRTAASRPTPRALFAARLALREAGHDLPIDALETALSRAFMAQNESLGAP